MTVTLSIALLMLRLVVGLTLVVHGTQKLFGWFAGSGLARLRQGFEKQGFKPAWLWVSFVILGEVGGGLSVALGFLTPLGALFGIVQTSALLFGALAVAALLVDVIGLLISRPAGAAPSGSVSRAS